MLGTAVSYQWNEKTRDFQRGGIWYLFPGRNYYFVHPVTWLFRQSDMLYRFIILRYYIIMLIVYYKSSSAPWGYPFSPQLFFGQIFYLNHLIFLTLYFKLYILARTWIMMHKCSVVIITPSFQLIIMYKMVWSSYITHKYSFTVI